MVILVVFITLMGVSVRLKPNHSMLRTVCSFPMTLVMLFFLFFGLYIGKVILSEM